MTSTTATITITATLKQKSLQKELQLVLFWTEMGTNKRVQFPHIIKRNHNGFKQLDKVSKSFNSVSELAFGQTLFQYIHFRLFQFTYNTNSNPASWSARNDASLQDEIFDLHYGRQRCTSLLSAWRREHKCGMQKSAWMSDRGFQTSYLFRSGML